jgi:hypothetical protein
VPEKNLDLSNEGLQAILKEVHRSTRKKSQSGRACRPALSGRNENLPDNFG